MNKTFVLKELTVLMLQNIKAVKMAMRSGQIVKESCENPVGTHRWEGCSLFRGFWERFTNNRMQNKS